MPCLGAPAPWTMRGGLSLLTAGTLLLGWDATRRQAGGTRQGWVCRRDAWRIHLPAKLILCGTLPSQGAAGAGHCTAQPAGCRHLGHHGRGARLRHCCSGGLTRQVGCQLCEGRLRCRRTGRGREACARQAGCSIGQHSVSAARSMPACIHPLLCTAGMWWRWRATAPLASAAWSARRCAGEGFCTLRLSRMVSCCRPVARRARALLCLGGRHCTGWPQRPANCGQMSCLARPLAANPWIPAQVQPAGLHRGVEQR